MHQAGHSRAQSMHTVQFSVSSAMTPRDRGGSADLSGEGPAPPLDWSSALTDDRG